MNILAIDPGPEQSAHVLWDGQRVLDKGLLENHDLVGFMERTTKFDGAHLVIEMIGHYGTGMPAGKSVFETCVWIGRFIQCWPRQRHELILRPTIKTHLCGSARAKDQNVRQALIDRFGAPGTKKEPGVLYGVSSHIWAALALAVCAHDRWVTFHQTRSVSTERIE